MSTKTSIKTASVTGPKAIITLDRVTNDQVNRKGLSTIYLEIPGGLQNWTKAKGTALEDFKNHMGVKNYALLMDNADQTSDKGGKFIAALRTTIESLGANISVPAIDAGMTTDMLAYQGGDDFIDKAFSPEGFASKAKEEASGPRIVYNTSGGIDSTNTGYSVLEYIFQPRQDSTTGKIYLVPRWNAPLYAGRRAYPLGSTEQRQVLSKAYKDVTGEVLPRNAQASIEDTAAGEAKADPKRITTVSRSYQDVDGAVWIDLGRDDCKCVKIAPEGWTLADMPANGEKVFIKDQAVREIGTDPVVPKDVPEAVGTLNRILRPLFNVNEGDWHLIIGWMVNHLLAERVSPILMMLGTGGSGKSTMCNAVNYAVEGGRTFPRSGAMKNDVDDVMVTIAKKRVSVFDNVSKLSGELSDTLAQAVYGMDYEKRELRTTDDVAVIKVNPSLILNGITTGHLREDLKSRMVTIRIAGTVPTDRQKDDLEIVREQTEGHPEVYGALLTLTSAVMKMMETGPKPVVSARMREYGTVLGALDSLLGWESLKRYEKSVQETSEDALDDPLLMSVVYLVTKNGTQRADGSWLGWVGTTQLATEFSNGASTLKARLSGEEMRLTPRQVPDRFSRVQGDWRRLGVLLGIGEKATGNNRPVIDGSRQAAYPVVLTHEAAQLIADAQQIKEVGYNSYM